MIRLTSDWGSNIASHSDWRSNNTIHPAQETQPGSSQSCLFELWITTCSVIQQPLGHLVILHKPGEENGKRNFAPGNEQTQEPIRPTLNTEQQKGDNEHDADSGDDPLDLAGAAPGPGGDTNTGSRTTELQNH